MTGSTPERRDVGRPDLLEAIVAATLHTVDVSMRTRSVTEVERDAARRTPRGAEFRSRLASGEGGAIIAECKRRSPSRGVLRADYDPVALATAYERAGAAAVSVLTEPAFFDGSLDHLTRVREAVQIPVLRKDFVVSPYQVTEARAHGADAVLLIVAALDDAALGRLLELARAMDLAALVEVHDRVELDRALTAGAEIIGVNNRNLRTLEVDVDASARLIDDIPADRVAVAESGLGRGTDLAGLRQAGYDAFLIGEALVTRPDPAEALRSLRRDAGPGPRGPRVRS